MNDLVVSSESFDLVFVLGGGGTRQFLDRVNAKIDPRVIWLVPEMSKEVWQRSGVKPSLDSQVYQYAALSGLSQDDQGNMSKLPRGFSFKKGLPSVPQGAGLWIR